ncbi:MAG: SMP-30/gluconolactonase/LRE family protein [Paracoccaceae bacterium]
MSPVFDHRPCSLGEGPLWHPERQQLFWFDILGRKLLTRDKEQCIEWTFDEHVSAAGWVDHDTLLMASETGLWRFSIETGQRVLVHALEAEDPVTRSNDGRADPWGGFWIGTMGKNAEAERGSIYRFFRGELRKLFDRIAISNAICFAPDRSHAVYSDTVTGRVMRQTLEADTGWPVGAPEVFLDLKDEGLNPDGAVMDMAGTLWVAQWGASRVAAYAPDGKLLETVSFAAEQTSCPAFGGDDMSTLFCTSARVGLSEKVKQGQPHNGMTFAVKTAARGQKEHKVIL